MLFSLLVPTRQRFSQFNKLLESIKNTISNVQNVEILVAIDKDDRGSIEYVNECKIVHHPELNIKPYIRERTIFLNRDYYNWLASFASGNYIWVSADDLIFLEKGWDITIASNIEGFLKNRKDRILCVGIKDNTPKPSPWLPPFPCFPLVTKEAYQALGFILHSEVPTWGADYLIYVLYNSVNRLIRIDNATYLNHVSYHTKQVESDEVSRRIGSIFNKLKMRPEHNIQLLEQNLIPKQIKVINDHIQNAKS